MITKAAVKILNLHTNEEMVLPCHRHCDIFYILKQLNMRKNIDYKELAQGFLDENDKFYNRVDAWKHAWFHKQIDGEYKPTELFSEDLY